MNPDLQRAVDFWLGTPLCFLLTLWRLVFGRRKPPAGPPRKILFIELAEMGGLVVAHPALTRARELFPSAELYFLTFDRGGGILELMEAMPPANLFLLRSSSPLAMLRDTLSALLGMRRLGIDAVINLEAFARFSSAVSFLSGASRRVGWHRFHVEGNYLGDLLTHRLIYNPHMHTGLAFISLVEALAQEPERGEPRGKLPLDPRRLGAPRATIQPGARAWAEQRLSQAFPGSWQERRLVLINPNASDLVAGAALAQGAFSGPGPGALAGPPTCIWL